MMSKLYAVFGVLVLLALSGAHFVGWSPTGANEVRGVPKTVRDNPGSYRSSYAGGHVFSGGK
jgi:hypothetical protein